MRLRALFGPTVLMALSVTATAVAGSTDWMSKSQAYKFAQNSKANKIHPTQIDCKDGGGSPLIRFTTKTTGPDKPFHKWNWVIGEAADLDKLVGKLKRSDKFELKYRIVSKKVFNGADGVDYGCALAYR